jgi:hypothetical protein
LSEDDLLQLRALIASMTLLRDDLSRDRARWEQERTTDRRVRRVLAVVSVISLLAIVGLWSEADGRREAVCKNTGVLRAVVSAAGSGGLDFTELDSFNGLDRRTQVFLVEVMERQQSGESTDRLLELIPPC